MMDFFISQHGFFSVMSLFLVGAVGSLILCKDDRAANIWSGVFSILGAIGGLIISVGILLGNEILSFSVGTSFPGVSLSFNIDYLSAFFVMVISFVGLASSVYGLGYAKHYFKKYNIGALGFFYNVFIAAMLGVVTTDNVVFFLIVWEIMSLASYFLVTYEKKEESSIKAGTLYFIMTHVGTAFILVAFLLLSGNARSFEFKEILAAAPSLSPAVMNIIFLAALVGFGTKAGIIPLHVWLPSAHPAAPSHVSALMSGVMIKTGIYMFIRIFFDILPAVPAWWGLTILSLGAVSSLLGVLYALAEHDLKKLLAYHSIENIGIIMLGLGSSLVFLSVGMPVLAAVGLVAAIYHTINHAVFKSLLFMGAGAVVSTTHTRNIEEYGGLVKYMPQTAFLFLVGSMAISALPPLNGFFSEWLTFQSLFGGIGALGATSKIIFIIAVGSLALTGGLAAACFVKAFGATFLARPRSSHATQAKEASVFERTGMAILAVAALALGIGAGQATSLFFKVANSLNSQILDSSRNFANFGAVNVNSDFASVSMAMVFAGIVIAVAATAVAVWFVSGRNKVKHGVTWNCGSDLTPRMEITSTGFAGSIMTVFRNVLRPSRQAEVEYHDGMGRYFPKTSTVSWEAGDIYRTFIYNPIHVVVTKISERVRWIQSGNVNAYVLYIFITLLVLLFINAM